MRGSIRERSKGSWRITLEFGYQPHPDTGKPKRVQKFVTFHGTKRQAQDKLIDLLGAVNRSEFGMNYMPDALGDEVVLMITIEGIRQ